MDLRSFSASLLARSLGLAACGGEAPAPAGGLGARRASGDRRSQPRRRRPRTCRAASCSRSRSFRAVADGKPLPQPELVVLDLRAGRRLEVSVSASIPTATSSTRRWSYDVARRRAVAPHARRHPGRDQAAGRRGEAGLAPVETLWSGELRRQVQPHARRRGRRLVRRRPHGARGRHARPGRRRGRARRRTAVAAAVERARPQARHLRPRDRARRSRRRRRARDLRDAERAEQARRHAAARRGRALRAGQARGSRASSPISASGTRRRSWSRRRRRRPRRAVRLGRGVPRAGTPSRSSATTPAPPPTRGVVVVTLDDPMCRFLTAGDVDGDGKRSWSIAAKDSGLWLLRPGADAHAALAPNRSTATRRASSTRRCSAISTATAPTSSMSPRTTPRSCAATSG